MSQYVFKMPDLGEGTVDAEIVAWHTRPGDAVTEDQLIVEVMTDKGGGGSTCARERPGGYRSRARRATRWRWVSPLIVFDVGEAATAHTAATPPDAPKPAAANSAAKTAAASAVSASAGAAPAARQGRVMASPANRRRAREGRYRLVRGGGGPVPAGAYCAAIYSRPAPIRRRRRQAPLECLRRREPRKGVRTFPRKRRNQGHRRASADRRANERSQTQHSAFRVRRRSRCHGTRIAAAAFEPVAAGGPPRV